MVEALTTVDFGAKVIAIRPNNIHSKYFLGDLEAIMLRAPDRFHGIILPKTESAQDIGHLSQLLDALERQGGEPLAAMRRELAALMHLKAGLVREAGGLREAAQRIAEMKDTYRSMGAGSSGSDYNFGLAQYLDMGCLLDVAEVVVASALAREESRGVHFRSDHPSRDDDRWQVHLLATAAAEAGPVLQENPTVASGA